MNIHVFTYLSRRLILIIAALFITVLSATANNGSRTPVFSTEDAPVWMLIHSAQNHYIHANYASSRNLWYVASTAEPAIFRPDMQWCFIGSQSGFIIKNINDNVKTIRYELGTRIRNQVRIIPELRFFIDDSLDYIERIDELLKQ